MSTTTVVKLPSNTDHTGRNVAIGIVVFLLILLIAGIIAWVIIERNKAVTPPPHPPVHPPTAPPVSPPVSPPQSPSMGLGISGNPRASHLAESLYDDQYWNHY